MAIDQDNRLRAVVEGFPTGGLFDSACPLLGGHIHDTYCVAVDAAHGRSHFLLQRINQHVFPDVAALMENVARVSAQMTAEVAGEPEPSRRAPALVMRSQGGWVHRDTEGACWRMLRWIEGAHTVDCVNTPEQAFRIARAFGRFQRQMLGLPGPPLREIIPGFHDTPRRFAAFEQAIARDAAGRVAKAAPEIAFAMARKEMSGCVERANLPRRAAHYDAKPSNVLLDDATSEALCVIDLDTVMPGPAVYDFGDLVRSCASPTAEDEQDISRVQMRFDYFEALARGYLSEAGAFLTHAEKQHLVAAGKVITFENGIRFLADYLAGDTYYKVHREGQNLDRCRTHFRLVESIEQQEDAMRALVDLIG